MTNDKETQKMLRLFNKLNKLFSREKISPLESISPLLVAAMEASITEKLSYHTFCGVVEDIKERFKNRTENE
jgi:hypothetical protein